MNDLEIITLNKTGITDFAEERNLLLKKAKAPWVLFLDSDEKATPELMAVIKNKINRERNLNGYYIKRKIFFLGKEIGEDKVLRLARKDAGEWKRAVHEVWDVRGRRGNLKNYIIHNTAVNLHDYIEKVNYYSTIHAAENIKEGKKSNLFKIIFYPKLKFLQNYLSGRGFVFSMLQSLHSFLAWVKQWELQKD